MGLVTMVLTLNVFILFVLPTCITVGFISYRLLHMAT